MNSTMIRLRLLGPFSASAGTRDVTAVFSHPKRLGLMTWLALTRPDGLHRRETICALLWPESSDQHARGALRQLLFTLRRELDEQAFIAEGDLLGLNREIVSSDAGAVLDALARGDDALAVSLYAGELLPGLHLGEGEEFERWFEQRRQELHRGVVQAAWRLVDQAGANGSDLLELRRLAESAFALDAEDEAGLRKLITAQARSGDRASALRAHETFARRLEADWGSAPEAGTTKLVERIRQGGLNGGVPDPGDPVPEPQTHLASSPNSGSEPANGMPARNHAGLHPRRMAPWLMAAGIVATLAVAAFRRARVDETLIPSRVMVVPFAVQSDSETTDVAGLVAADWVIQGLQQTGRVEVVDPATAFLSTRDLRDRAPREMSELREVARRASAGFLVVGTITRARDSVFYTARVINTRDGRVVRSLDPIAGPLAEPNKALDDLRARVAGAIAIEADRPVIPVSRGEGPPRLDAYEQFVLGLEEFVTETPGIGRRYFEEAIRLDPSFTLARMWLYYSLDNNGLFDTARAVVQGVAASADRSTPVVAAWLVIDSLELAKAPLDVRLAAYQRAARLSPGSHNEWNLTHRLHEASRVREALVILQRFNREQNWFTRWSLYWYNLGSDLHRVGDYREEISAWQRAQQRYPYMMRSSHPRTLQAPPWEVFGYAALGDSVTVRAKLERAFEAVRSDTVPWLLGLYSAYSGVELEAHGYVSAGLAQLEWTEARLTSHLPTDTTIATRLNLAYTRAILAFYRQDRDLARAARIALEHQLPAVEGNGNLHGNSTVALFLAICAEGDPDRIAALQSAPQARLALCRGEKEKALEALGLIKPDWTSHSWPLFRAIRGDPRFRRWVTSFD